MSETKKNALLPALRFPEFKEDGEWVEKKLGEIATFLKGKGISKSDINEEGEIPCIRYGELYTDYQEIIKKIKSFTNVDTSELILSNANDVIIPSSGETQIDIATASCILNEGVAIGGDLNIIRSFLNGVFLAYYLNSAKKIDIASIAQGVSVVHLYSNQLKELFINIPPTTQEQEKIAGCLSSLDELIEAERQRLELLKVHKKGLLQNLFPRPGEKVPRLRFPEFKGQYTWEPIKLSQVLTEHRLKSEGNEEVYSVSVHKGVINQIEHLGRRFAASNTKNYKRVLTGDVIYTKSPTGDFPFGIVKQSKLKKPVIVSPLYGVFTPETSSLGYILDAYFESPIRTNNYLAPIVQKGAKNTINIRNDVFLSKSLILPRNPKEQEKIAGCLSSLDELIEAQEARIEKLELHKKGLMQGLFPNPAAINARRSG